MSQSAGSYRQFIFSGNIFVIRGMNDTDAICFQMKASFVVPSVHLALVYVVK